MPLRTSDFASRVSALGGRLGFYAVLELVFLKGGSASGTRRTQLPATQREEHRQTTDEHLAPGIEVCRVHAVHSFAEELRA